MKQNSYSQIIILFISFVIVGSLAYSAGKKSDDGNISGAKNQRTQSFREEDVLPESGIVLPAVWDDLGLKMINAGVIDKEKFERLYDGRGGLTEAGKRLLEGSDNGKLVINSENSGLLLNLLWALGLGNKNEILENGPMSDKRYGGAGNFASTGGWTIAQDRAMDHYSKHSFMVLTPEQQALVEDVSKNIYRPCCGNSTHFPDCNHGMAMLGLLELMASQGATEGEMYDAALAVNSFWFPDTYMTIAKYLKSQGKNWSKADPKEILGFNYSSSQGYNTVLSKVKPEQFKGGGGCSV